MNFFISISPPAFPPSLPTAAANPSGIVDSRIPWLIVTFRAFPCILSDLLSPTAPTFSVWVLGALWHEQQAWTRYLYSQRDDPAKYAYAQDQLPDTAVLLACPHTIKPRSGRGLCVPFWQAGPGGGSASLSQA